MWFLLPDEGVTPEELLSDSETMDFLLTTEKFGWENQKPVIVHKSIPKFDVSSQFDLRASLQALGITDVFDPALSDFAPMSTDRPFLFCITGINGLPLFAGIINTLLTAKRAVFCAYCEFAHL